MDDREVLWHAAGSVSDTLVEVLRVQWPVCSEHGGEPMAPNKEELLSGMDDGLIWWCRYGSGHPVAFVGQLTAGVVRPR